MMLVMLGGSLPKPMLMYQNDVGCPVEYWPGIKLMGPPVMGHFVRFVDTPSPPPEEGVVSAANSSLTEKVRWDERRRWKERRGKRGVERLTRVPPLHIILQRVPPPPRVDDPRVRVHQAKQKAKHRQHR